MLFVAALDPEKYLSYGVSVVTSAVVYWHMLNKLLKAADSNRNLIGAAFQKVLRMVLEAATEPTIFIEEIIGRFNIYEGLDEFGKIDDTDMSELSNEVKNKITSAVTQFKEKCNKAGSVAADFRKLAENLKERIMNDAKKIIIQGIIKDVQSIIKDDQPELEKEMMEVVTQGISKLKEEQGMIKIEDVEANGQSNFVKLLLEPCEADGAKTEACNMLKNRLTPKVLDPKVKLFLYVKEKMHDLDEHVQGFLQVKNGLVSLSTISSQQGLSSALLRERVAGCIFDLLLLKVNRQQGDQATPGHLLIAECSSLVKELLPISLTEIQLWQIFTTAADQDGDGTLDKNEFVDSWRSIHKALVEQCARCISTVEPPRSNARLPRTAPSQNSTVLLQYLDLSTLSRLLEEYGLGYVQIVTLLLATVRNWAFKPCTHSCTCSCTCDSRQFLDCASSRPLTISLYSHRGRL